MTTKPRVAVIHHNILEHQGGGDFVCAFALDALKDRYEVSLITWGRPLDWSLVDTYYGTHLGPDRVRVYRSPLMTFLRLNNRPFRLILALFERYVKRLGGQFDLLISTYNEFDFGRPGIQYIHGPSRSTFAAQLYLLTYKEGALRKAYHRFCDWLSGFDSARVDQNLTLSNSEWGREVFRKTYPGRDATVLYPPVVLPEGQPAPWAERPTCDFVCIGDLIPEKKTQEALDVIRQLRQNGIPARLHIVGDGASDYAESIKQQCKTNDFFIFEGRLNRTHIAAVVRRYRYGIHMRDFEGFGIAVAEMVVGGMIPFAHEGGGQAEVVGGNPALLFKDLTDAHDKIVRVVNDEGLQSRIRADLSKRSLSFAGDNFRSNLLRIVEDFQKSHG